MSYPEAKTFGGAGKIFLLALFALLQWSHPTHAFKAQPSGKYYHKTLVHQGLTGISVELQSANPKKTIEFSDAAILDIQKSARKAESENLLVALGESEFKDGELHCDNEQLMACSARILKYRKQIVATLISQPLSENAGPMVWASLGKALHTVQDYYSHSNWVERGNTQINDYLLGDPGKAGGVLPAGELPPKPNAAVADACQPKSGGGSEIVNLGSYPTSGYLLRDSVCDVGSAHPGRCVHGCTGPLCEQAPDSTCQGMNKDTPDELGGHAQGRHQTAAALAINATTEFVTQIISDVQNQQGISQDQKDQALCAMMGSSACTSILPIIPGMVGFGMETPAGSGPNRSGGRIIHVTNLFDSGAGSLRAALLASGPRIVVFDVSGYIELLSRIDIVEPYLTIAGQTAPYPGISIKGAGISLATHDVLIQHIRLRVGDGPYGPHPSIRDGITILGKDNGLEASYNIVIDHVSVSWATDENISIWYEGVHDVTVANCVIGEGIVASFGFLVGYQTTNLLVMGNLFAHNNDRNIKLKATTSSLLVNNLIYNWKTGPSIYGSSSEAGTLDASIVGNVYIRGVDTTALYPIKLNTALEAGSRVYIEDIVSVETTGDPWSDVKIKTPAQVKVDVSPNWLPSLKPKKGNTVKNWVQNNAGARRADGDPVDLRIISDVINGTGRIIASQDDVGGWPPLVNNVRGTGGVPDLDIPFNPNEIQTSGYTKIEEWLHLLAEQVEAPKGSN